MKKNVKAYVIDLPARPRWGDDCVKLLAPLGIDATVFPGVDGRDANAARSLTVHPYRFASRWKRPPLPGEIGVFASFVNFSKGILEGVLNPVSVDYPDWFLVFEDDALPSPGMNAELISEVIVRADADKLDFVFLHSGRKGQRGQSPFDVKPQQSSECFAHACLIHRRAASRIATWRMYEPIDIAMSKNPMKKGVLWGSANFYQRSRDTAPHSIHFERTGKVPRQQTEISIPPEKPLPEANSATVTASRAQPDSQRGVIVADCLYGPGRGLGNNITVICSAYAAAKFRGWDLVVAWKPKPRCGVEWEDLFLPLADIPFVNKVPKSGIIHRAAYYHRNAAEHGRAIGQTERTPEYWQAWKEIAKMIQLRPDLALPPQDSPFSAISLRLNHPRWARTDWWLNSLPEMTRPFVAADSPTGLEIVRRRFPDAWSICDAFQTNDKDYLPRGLDQIQAAARDMMMLCKAERIITFGRDSTFRNLAHLGYGIPILKCYHGANP